MSVDWYECKVCGNSFNDCGYMVWCECGKNWCSDKCAEKDGYLLEEGQEEGTCKYCRKEDVEDSVLLQFLLERFVQSDRESAVKEYFDFNGRNK